MVAISDIKEIAERFLDWVSRVVFREEKWVFNSRLNSEEILKNLRLYIEHGAPSRWWVPDGLRLQRSEMEFRGEIGNNHIKIFRRVGLINWVTGNKMYYFSGWIRPMSHGARIEGKYLIAPSLRIYFSMVAGLYCLTSLIIVGIAATRIVVHLFGGAIANHTGLFTNMMLVFVPIVIALAGYALFGFFKTIDRVNKLAMFGFLERVVVSRS